MRVLIVEDEPTLCDVYEDFLSRRGHEAVITQSAEAALERLETQRPDVVILDVRLPGTRGLDLLKLRIADEMALPVIVVSGPREFMGEPVALEGLGDAIDALDAAAVPSAAAQVAPHLRILAAIAEAATGTLDTEGTLQVALDALTHITGHETSSLHLVSEDGRTLRLRGERGLSPELRRVNETLIIGEGFIGRVAATGETCNVSRVIDSPDLLADARDAVRAAGVVTFLCVAIKSHGRTVGTLSLGRRSPDEFTPAEVALVEASAAQVGLALGNARLAREARRHLDDLRRAEAQLAASARLSTVGQLAAGLAHDVAQPLTAILGHVELMLLRDDQSADTRRRLAVVLEEATRASRLCHSLLHLGRPRHPERTACELDREVGLVLSLIAPHLRRTGVRVITEFSATPAVWADPDQIRQVLLNLVQNAVQALASHPGERVITVRIEPRDDGARIEVLDTGPGIPPETLPQIFDAFFTTKPAGEGTGLGLWGASTIIAEHDGRLWAESRPEGGAAFIIELPMQPRRSSATE